MGNTELFDKYILLAQCLKSKSIDLPIPIENALYYWGTRESRFRSISKKNSNQFGRRFIADAPQFDELIVLIPLGETDETEEGMLSKLILMVENEPERLKRYWSQLYL